MGFSYLSTPHANQDSWTIIGAGPVGAMQAVILGAIFPYQKIYVLDRYRKNVRGHGLQILNDTTRNIIKELKKIKTQTEDAVKNNALDKLQITQYQQRIDNINKLTTFLRKKFMGFNTGPFIRTYMITEMLREFAEKNLQTKIDFKLDKEVTTEHLKIAAGKKFPPAKQDEVHKVLSTSSLVFGADGANSAVRGTVFGERNEDLDKKQLTYVLEIKLDMKVPRKAIDVLKKTLYPTLAKGHLHVWSQGSDGTATLHIFIDKKQYDEIKSKKSKGMTMGEFSNPYRRLADLPETLRKPIESSITNVVGLNDFDENSLKITALPMATYTAKKLVKEANKKVFALVGDSAVGLVLERGVNNGFNSTVEYARAISNMYFKKPISQSIASAYLDNKKNDLVICENRIKARAEKVKKEIMRKIDAINFHKKWFGHALSSFFAYERAVPKIRDEVLTSVELSKDKIQILKKNIYSPDYDTEKNLFLKNAEWLFNIDRLTYYLDKKTSESGAKKLSPKKHVELNQMIDATARFVSEASSPAVTASVITKAISEYESEIKDLNESSNPLVKAVLKSSWKLTLNEKDITKNVLLGLKAFNHLSSNKRNTSGFFGKKTLDVKSYQCLLNRKDISSITKLCLIYSLLDSKMSDSLKKMIIEKFPKPLQNEMRDIKEEILKIIKMKVPMTDLTFFNKQMAHLSKCIAQNKIPTANLTTALDDIFAKTHKNGIDSFKTYRLS